MHNCIKLAYSFRRELPGYIKGGNELKGSTFKFQDSTLRFKAHSAHPSNHLREENANVDPPVNGYLLCCPQSVFVVINLSFTKQAQHLKQQMCTESYFYKTEPQNHNSIAFSKTLSCLKPTLNSKLFQKPPTFSYPQAVGSPSRVLLCYFTSISSVAFLQSLPCSFTQQAWIQCSPYI